MEPPLHTMWPLRSSRSAPSCRLLYRLLLRRGLRRATPCARLGDAQGHQSRTIDCQSLAARLNLSFSAKSWSGMTSETECTVTMERRQGERFDLTADSATGLVEGKLTGGSLGDALLSIVAQRNAFKINDVAAQEVLATIKDTTPWRCRRRYARIGDRQPAEWIRLCHAHGAQPRVVRVAGRWRTHASLAVDNVVCGRLRRVCTAFREAIRAARRFPESSAT